MKTFPFFTVSVLTAAFIAAGASAQTSEPTAPPEAASPAAPTPVPDQVIYIPRLPSPAEVANAAAAQGLAIEKIAQTAAQVTVVYRRADGQTSTVAYQLLPAAGTPATVVTAAPATVVTAPPATVVYASPAPVYYYDPFYSPWPWFGAISVDLGYNHGFRHYRGGRGYNHGGYSRGGGGHRGGGGDHGGGHRRR